MNKYLLLRDNKQSGPYTVDEIIAKGIKAYDLVWLEGKSAAWRYPSEIEELKAHAPVTEEQPFDRFYKKPEAASESNSRFEPKPVITGINTAVVSPSKRVYINFPGAQQKLKNAEPIIVAEAFPETVKAEEPEKILIDKPAVYTIENNANSSRMTPKKNDRRLLYAGIAACFLLVGFIMYFAIGYSSQKKDIDQLSSLVQKLEERARNQNTIITPAVTSMSNPLPAEEVPVVNEPVTETHENIIQVKKQPASVKPENKPLQSVSSASIQTAVLPVQKNVVTVATTHENLFNLVSVKSNKYKTGVLGGISNLELQITNNSLVPLQRVAVEIKYLGPEKRVVRTQTVYFENISPGSQSVLAIPKSNRGVTVDYIITDIRS